MLKIKDIYKFYIDDIDRKINNNISRKEKAISQLEYLYNLLYTNYSDVLNNTKVNLVVLRKIIDNKHKEKTTIANFAELEGKVDDMLFMYLSSFIRLSYNRRIYNTNISAFKLARVSFKLFRYIIHLHNNKVSHSLLRGMLYNFGYNVGVISIRLKKRTYSSGCNYKVIDWGESLKLLKLLAKEHNDDTCNLLNDYTTKLIRKQDFIRLLKPYNFKWLVYNTDPYNLWFWWSKPKYANFNTHPYSFVPSNFINTKSRSQHEFSDSANDVDDIIESNLIGNRDKLAILKRFDTTYYLKFNEVKAYAI